MISLRPAQSNPLPPFFPSTSPLPTDLFSTLARSEFIGVTLAKNFSKRAIFPLFIFNHLQIPCSLFFALAKISPLFSHSSQRQPAVPPTTTQLSKHYLNSFEP